MLIKIWIHQYTKVLITMDALSTTVGTLTTVFTPHLLVGTPFLRSKPSPSHSYHQAFFRQV